MAVLYVFQPPITLFPTVGPMGPHCKPGITFSYPDGRRSKYQLPYGPYWEASFAWICSHDDPAIIKWIEQQVQGHFRHRCCTIGAGMTEWLMDTSWEDIRKFVLELCAATDIQITDHGPGPWNSIRIEQEFGVEK